MNVIAVLCARNEERYLKATVKALNSQSLPLSRIIVVNDGSTDATAQIAAEHGCSVIHLPCHEGSYRGKPLMAKVWNSGLDQAKQFNPDYLLSMGADHVLPVHYVQSLVERMELDNRLVVCSGVIDGEVGELATPRGSGRLTKADYWSRLNGLTYPVYWGWEEYVLFKALQEGYTVRCFLDVRSSVQRATRQLEAVDQLLIPEMYVLGYSWPFIIAKCVRDRMPLSEFVHGVRLTRHLKKLDFAEYVRKTCDWKLVSTLRRK